MDFVRLKSTGKHAKLLKETDSFDGDYYAIKDRLLTAAGLTMKEAGERLHNTPRREFREMSGVDLNFF